MAAKKYYAVKKGRRTGVFYDWETCRASIEGFSGAEYKGFVLLKEAKAYLGEEDSFGGMSDSVGMQEAGQRDEAVETHTMKPKPRKIQVKKSGQDEEDEQRRTAKTEHKKKQVPRTEHDREAEQLRNGGQAPQIASPGDRPQPGTLLSYVDGSYDHSLKKYAFGCIFILPDGRIKTRYGNGDNAQSLQQRNVAGEMLGAMYAVRTAMVSGFSRIEIRYDYEGIEKWVTGAWRAKTELTQKYAAAMRKWGETVGICFTKVAAHSNVYYNEMADKTAKAGLREADGVPKVCHVEELPDMTR